MNVRTQMVKPIKAWVKRNLLLTRLNSEWHFIRGVPKKDLWKLGKINLFLKIKPYTMLTYPRLLTLFELGTILNRDRVKGCFAEFGVCRGGSAAVLHTVANRHPKRHVWLFDSWQGLPDASALDETASGETFPKGALSAPETIAKGLLYKTLRFPAGRGHFVKGWFHETIPSHKKAMGDIALLHLDGDYYESIKICLEELYDQVVPDGYVVIDDYCYWKGCKKAVDEFMLRRGIKHELRPTDNTGIHFRKREFA
ncbi:MAG: class I SAM-dependent methyltransferase [Candidatus Omnitrophica bacterium]|nr:class I SAM-dependent methyltransferase [Candidatus Omnitrophota bacterium]